MKDLVGPPQQHALAASEGLAGSTAVIAGLQSRPELNGERVNFGRFQLNGRYEVCVRGEYIALRPGNLQRVMTGAATGAPPVPPETAG